MKDDLKKQCAFRVLNKNRSTYNNNTFNISTGHNNEKGNHSQFFLHCIAYITYNNYWLEQLDLVDFSVLL